MISMNVRREVAERTAVEKIRFLFFMMFVNTMKDFVEGKIRRLGSMERAGST